MNISWLRELTFVIDYLGMVYRIWDSSTKYWLNITRSWLYYYWTCTLDVGKDASNYQIVLLMDYFIRFGDHVIF